MNIRFSSQTLPNGNKVKDTKSQVRTHAESRQIGGVSGLASVEAEAGEHYVLTRHSRDGVLQDGYTFVHVLIRQREGGHEAESVGAYAIDQHTALKAGG